MAPSSPPNSDAPDGNERRAAAGRKNLKPFKKGQSGNPGGLNNRAKEKIAFAMAAREYGEEALETLVKLMRQKRSGELRLRAAIALLDRGYGKPAESLEIENKKFVAFVPLPLEREEWLAAVQKHRVNGHGVTIEQSPSPSEPGSLPPSKLNS